LNVNRPLKSPKALSTFLFIGILLLGLLIRLDHFTERWSDYFVPNWWSHMGWSGAFYSPAFAYPPGELHGEKADVGPHIDHD